MRRWTKDALPPKSYVSKSNSVSSAENINGVDSTIREIQFYVESCINRLVTNMEQLHIFKDQQKEIMEKVYVANPPKKIDKDKRMADMLGVTVPPEVRVKVPHDIRNKGCGSGGKKRMKSKREVAINKFGKKFHKCHTCGEIVDDHDSRNCLKKSQASTSKDPSTQIRSQASTSKRPSTQIP